MSARATPHRPPAPRPLPLPSHQAALPILVSDHARVGSEIEQRQKRDPKRLVGRRRLYRNSRRDVEGGARRMTVALMSPTRQICCAQSCKPMSHDTPPVLMGPGHVGARSCSHVHVRWAVVLGGYAKSIHHGSGGYPITTRRRASARVSLSFLDLVNIVAVGSAPASSAPPPHRGGGPQHPRSPQSPTPQMVQVMGFWDRPRRRGRTVDNVPVVKPDLQRE